MYTNITISIDSDVKEQADALFSELGMDLNTAFNLFVRESLRVGGIPFELTPNKETIEAMEEAKRITYDSSVKCYNNLDELFEELKS
ncbi:type II toxin-antitoxin system RelB/DinJ family antitoxin [uncultured Catenibacterium sp.]|uniref:type II toxin-antitoxin system RelB/DinJ family antitoxin n=1 Tax=uncultured Catenibacterium sp. TaxID=286142 RepID=UPI0025D7765A|nr:type II toxin-antitoxin system RelB/DinJ family antitoxin [uncultured Catenibacterium sp.]